MVTDGRGTATSGVFLQPTVSQFLGAFPFSDGIS